LLYSSGGGEKGKKKKKVCAPLGAHRVEKKKKKGKGKQLGGIGVVELLLPRRKKKTGPLSPLSRGKVGRKREGKRRQAPRRGFS